MQDWQRYQEYLFRDEALGFALDISRMEFRPSFFDKMAGLSTRALDAMEALEGGAIANPDEGRMVGHYWLRAPELAPVDHPEIRREIEATLARIRAFALGVHTGAITAENGEPFRNVLLIGIGGSALGPQFVVDALGGPDQALRVYFLDNTDPDGMDRIFAELGDGLSQTLSVVTSKSGGTEETRNGMLEAQAVYARAGLDFGRHAVAVTGEGSKLDKIAVAGGWLDRFPMWDWIGGRTSVTSAVGLLPAALLGYDIDGLLRGAREMDAATRERDARRNPALLLALMWYYAGGGRGEKDMVVLPYKDRLSLCAKYLQQLVMESLGKEFDLQGNMVNQGIVVYGNKGSTDQHAYIQQLREGARNFFATFIQVLDDRSGEVVQVEPGVTSGDSLLGFLLGTREALAENYRESVTITLDRVDAVSLGQLIALYERAVGLYASLIGINAYHQPGVEGGKKAAGAVIRLQKQVVPAVQSAPAPLTADEVAASIDAAPQVELVYHILRHLSANPGRGVRRIPGEGPGQDRFQGEKV